MFIVHSSSLFKMNHNVEILVTQHLFNWATWLTLQLIALVWIFLRLENTHLIMFRVVWITQQSLELSDNFFTFLDTLCYLRIGYEIHTNGRDNQDCQSSQFVTQQTLVNFLHVDTSMQPVWVFTRVWTRLSRTFDLIAILMNWYVLHLHEVEPACLSTDANH